MENKKYYWIKLRKDFFERDDIDFILSQEKGCEYIVLYQMLCMKASNNEGFLGTKINEVIIPYDVKKITRDCKYFDYDTVMVALELYKQLGLVYEESNNVLRISDYDNLVGSETVWAEKKRLYREKQKLLGQKGDNVREDIDIELDIDIDNNIKKKDISKDISKKESFVKPTLEDVKKYCEERNNEVDAETFIDFYESKDWYVGKNKMKDWKASVRTWEKNNRGTKKQSYLKELEEQWKKEGVI